MKIKTEDLRAALKATAPAVMVNANNPLLAAVHLAAAEGELRARTTDHDTWIETRVAPVQADVAEWAAAVSHRLLDKIANLARAKETEIVPGERVLNVSAGKAAWELPLIVGEPPLWTARPDAITTLEGEAFASLVSRIATAAADKDGFNPPLNVVELAVADGRLRCAATDRYRMHLATVDADADSAPRVIYPLAARLVDTASALSGRVVTIGATADGALFSIADERTVIQSRAVSVEKWLKLADNIAAWKSKTGGTTLIPADDLANAIKAAMVTLPDGEGVRVEATPESFIVGSVDAEAGGRATIPLEDFEHTGRGIFIYLNPRIALPALAACGPVPVEIAWTGPRNPALVSVPGIDGVYALAPMGGRGGEWIDAEGDVA